ncbi:helix-turn-helix domain-containing protein [Burkholderia sp. BE12]|uniref:helix-turn-helix domain-containing protein n=1 Tax=Burkholderia sp. BE12 TaxID=2082394 RepID=UPI000CF37018|nr:helix-turn-helix transcriptional regulator [Burkholderia sp. BE12]
MNKPSAILAAFAAKLRELRKEKGWTIEQFAERVGSTASQISRYERGEMTPNFLTIVRLADSLDVTLDEMCCMELARGES